MSDKTLREQLEEAWAKIRKKEKKKDEKPKNNPFSVDETLQKVKKRELERREMMDNP